MNDETRNFLKQAAMLITSATIGGLISGCLVCGFTKCNCQMHFVKHSFSRMPRDEFRIHEDFDKMHKRIMKDFEESMKMPEFKDDFFEEDYVIVPKKFIKFKKGKQEPFEEPKHFEKRH